MSNENNNDAPATAPKTPNPRLKVALFFAVFILAAGAGFVAGQAFQANITYAPEEAKITAIHQMDGYSLVDVVPYVFKPNTEQAVLVTLGKNTQPKIGDTVILPDFWQCEKEHYQNGCVSVKHHRAILEGK